MCNNFRRVYRGFACKDEALNVLKNGTAGGLLEVDDGLFRDEGELKKRIDKQIQTEEGIQRIVDKSKKREGIIEYSFSPYTALGFGTLCTIGCDVDLSANQHWSTPNSECSVILRQDCKILIREFRFGMFFGKRTEFIPKDLQEFSPICIFYQGGYRDREEDIMKSFVQELSNSGIAVLLKSCDPII